MHPPTARWLAAMAGPRIRRRLLREQEVGAQYSQQTLHIVSVFDEDGSVMPATAYLGIVAAVAVQLCCRAGAVHASHMLCNV
jgi:hypothetical protein